MQVKTITCHDVYNVGASLQAYALMAYLRDLGHDAEIIDYKPDYLSGHYSLTALANLKYDRPGLKQLYLLAKLPGRLKALCGQRKKSFDLFREQYLRLTSRYNSFCALAAEPPMADVYFAGSDQIWNSFFRNGRDPAFYLSFAPEESLRASYAASFATEEISQEYKAQVGQWLRGLDYISVRESSGLGIVSQFGLKAVQVMDPVFLLDAGQWEKLCKPIGEKYIFVYDFDKNPELRRMAEKLSKDSGLPIYSLQDLGYAEKSFSDAGPIEFLSLVKAADYVLSNSFHATAFSLIFEKEFWVINRHEQINTRMRDLTASVGLPGRLLSHTEEPEMTRIDYAQLSFKVRELIKGSKDYIDLVLASAQKQD